MRPLVEFIEVSKEYPMGERSFFALEKALFDN